MPLLHLNGTNKLTPTQLYESSRIATPVKLGLAVSLLTTLVPVALLNTHLKMNSNQTRTSNYEHRLHRPKPPSPEMVQRAQPYRAETLQVMEAVIKSPKYQFTE
jgi:hypothetical protein